MSKIAEAAYGDRPYNGSPGWKEPTTSRAAARSMEAAAPTLRDRILAALTTAGEKGLTPDEAAALLDEDVLAVRPRFTELSKAVPPLIVATGLTRANASRRAAKVWRAA